MRNATAVAAGPDVALPVGCAAVAELSDVAVVGAVAIAAPDGTAAGATDAEIFGAVEVVMAGGAIACASTADGNAIQSGATARTIPSVFRTFMSSPRVKCT
jgi:hypothetical protein